MRRNQSREREVHREPEAGDGGHREGQPPTPRQLEIFQTVAASRSRADAADALGISEQSIKNQFSHLFRRLGVGGELQAAWVLWGRRRKASDNPASDNPSLSRRDRLRVNGPGRRAKQEPF